MTSMQLAVVQQLVLLHAPPPANFPAPPRMAALTTEPYTLASLDSGTRLQGDVVGHHRNKLFLRVPVVRPTAGGEKRVDAMLKLPWNHRLLKNPEASMGKTLQVYVCKARVADATLVVTVKPPSPPELRGLSWRERLAAAPSCTPLEQLATGDALEGRVLKAHKLGVSAHDSREARRPLCASTNACVLPRCAGLPGGRRVSCGPWRTTKAA